MNGLAVEATARFRAASALGIGVFPSAGVGRIYLGYEPERVTVQLDPGSPPLAVTFSPIDEWLVSLGMALERPVVSRLLCSLAVEREFFALDTSHRNGAQIVEERESFGGWNVRLGLSWGWGG